MNERRKEIVFVDDDAHVLAGLRRMLRPMRQEWDMHFVESADEAYAMLDERAIDVIVTDMHMAQTDGVQLLEKVRDRDPGVARIMLSGSGDREAAMRSASSAHQFLAKPCEADDLKRAVQRCCQLRALLSEEKLVSTVAGVGALPSLPEIYKELSNEMSSEDVSIERIGAIVAKDLAMTAKVLQLVNSAFFGLPRRIETVEHAVSLLGTETIRSLVLSTAIFESFDNKKSSLRLEPLWDHSLAVGSVAHALAKAEDAGKAVADECQQAGMLHDIGHLILGTSDPEQYRKARALAGQQRISMHAAETSIFGCDHAQVGAYLLGLWGLPDAIVEAVAYHHRPDELATDTFTPLLAVHAANALSHRHTEGDESIEGILNERALRAARLGGRVEHWAALTRNTLEQAEPV